ncbi:hypothetical protein MtrunA17_Chr8g0373151 [Medicago truncatula]|uniref:Transmembrane protein n=1 Tax=Medicago truncatula TaxID=3880 RepID=A0A396GNV9_MEDTR|nr:hypothetical protein MtrunA17_Chr8g0373151 [Medicago truncatula]
MQLEIKLMLLKMHQRKLQLLKSPRLSRRSIISKIHIVGAYRYKLIFVSTIIP